MGQFNVGYIIAVALPALMFMYPVTIVLILLNLVPEKWSSAVVFRTVVLATLLFSIPDFLGSVGLGSSMAPITTYIPFCTVHMGWVLPALLSFTLSNAVLLRSRIEKT